MRLLRYEKSPLKTVMGNACFTSLFVEDDENDIVLTQRVLRQLGASFARFVRNGIELMDYLEGREKYNNRALFPIPQVIVTDLKMPLCGGFEAIEWLNQRKPFRKIPVFILTSSVQERDIERARALGVHSYFRKPSDYYELRQTLCEAFEPWMPPKNASHRAARGVSTHSLIPANSSAERGGTTAVFRQVNSVRLSS